ncbi:Fc.00g055880.m01.CDS01 [Cosmosporella sp. VM-42]
MAVSFNYGFTLPNGSKIIHGEGVMVKDAYPPELKIPGQLQVFNPGHGTDPKTPAFCGPHGVFAFDTNLRMPRHVHMSPRASGGGNRYIVEKILVLNGVALAELSGQVFVIPPNTMVLIGPGVPHTWTACPPGLDLQELGVSKDDRIVSEGKFTAVYEYEEPTAFFPTAQTNVLMEENEYVRCDDLHGIKIPAFTIEELKENAWFVWGRGAQKLRGGR